MEEEIRICPECQQEELKYPQSKYCQNCRPNIQIRRMASWRNKNKNKKKEKEVETFPIWTCPNGHINQLKFNPAVHKRKWGNYECIVDGCEERPVAL